MIDWTGPRRQPCPACDRGPRDTALAVDFDGVHGVAFCHRCHYTATTRGQERTGSPRPAPHTPIQHERLSRYGRELWASCRPIGGEALAYLRARQCVVPPTDGDLRWHPALCHPPTDYHGPALVGLVTDARTGEPMSLHRTWVRADGSKAPVNPPRMLLGGHRKAGGVIRLWHDESVTHELGIAEGVETALALARVRQPVWAAIDAGNLQAFPLLGGIEQLTIAVDNDPAGLSASEAVARRWKVAGRAVDLFQSEVEGEDAADLVSRVAA